MDKWVWTGFLGLMLLAGCQQDQALILDSTPRTRTPETTAGRTSAGSDNFAEHKRTDWATTAPIAGRLDPMGEVTRITVHHSGEVNELNSEADIVAHLRGIQTSQCRSKASGGLGAGDVAYHFIIDRNGEVWEGRSLRYQGAHAGNSTANRGNIGICVLGNFNVQYPSPHQQESLKELLERLMTSYNLDANNIYTHREIRAYYGLSATECPGRNLQSVTETVRQGFTGGRSTTLARQTRR